MERQKRNSIFVDSNYFIALANPKDSLHTVAFQLSKQIASEKYSVVISNLIVAETLTIISQKLGRKPAITTSIAIHNNPDIEIIFIDRQLHERSLQLFNKIDKKNMSFIDCSILAVMQKKNIKQLLTFDHADFQSLQKKYHFKLFG